jgi:asparagine synthetase B (glutamine-hydrolysing)
MTSASQRTAEFEAAMTRLEACVRGHGPMVVACSGGVDSALLAVVAQRVLGERMLCVLGVSASLASAEHRDLFKSDPAHYAPQFGNACTTTLSRGGFKEVDPQAWVIHEDKLYMFGGIAGVPMFAKDPAGYITKANQNRSVIPKS